MVFHSMLIDKARPRFITPVRVLLRAAASYNTHFITRDVASCFEMLVLAKGIYLPLENPIVKVVKFH